MDGGAWRATVHRVAKSQTRLSDWHQHCCPQLHMAALVPHPFDIFDSFGSILFWHQHHPASAIMALKDV